MRCAKIINSEINNYIRDHKLDRSEKKEKRKIMLLNLSYYDSNITKSLLSKKSV